MGPWLKQPCIFEQIEFSIDIKNAGENARFKI